jgi:hypothetical protein
MLARDVQHDRRANCLNIDGDILYRPSVLAACQPNRH